MALDPVATLPQLTETLSKRLNHSFDPRYFKKLRDKSVRQTLMEADRTQIEERMNFTRENYRMMRERLLKIIYWKPAEDPGSRRPWNGDVIDAAKTLVMLDLALLKAEIEIGMYKKPLEVLAKEIHYAPLAPEVRTVIIQSWRNFGMLPAATIEEMVPEKTS